MSLETAAGLDRQFGIPGIAQVVEGNGSLPAVRITAPGASGEMYLHGGHVTSWKPRGWDEVLFVSSQTRWEDGRAIRGGVPVCFPWFGGKSDNSKAPAHGVVRTTSWQLESIVQNRDSVTVIMFMEGSVRAKDWWPDDFRLIHRVTFGPVLTMELVITNTSRKAQRFEEALHTYFKVGDVEQVRVRGLEGVSYSDKADQDRLKLQRGDIAIASETDRTYLQTGGPVELADPVLGRLVRLEKVNSSTTVVWNPWVERAKALPDLGDDEWRRMLCIEAANAGDAAVSLPSGGQHTMRATISVTPPSLTGRS